MMWAGSDRKQLSSLVRTDGVTSVVNSADSSAGFIRGSAIGATSISTASPGRLRRRRRILPRVHASSTKNNPLLYILGSWIWVILASGFFADRAVAPPRGDKLV
jgi:hypothetical protein